MASGIYTSNYTGTEIDKAVAFAGSISYTTDAPIESVGTSAFPQLQVAFLPQIPSNFSNGWIYVIYDNNNTATDIIAVLLDGTQIVIK